MQNKVSRLALPQWWGFEDKGQNAGWFLLKNSESQIKNYENCKTDFLSKIYYLRLPYASPLIDLYH